MILTDLPEHILRQIFSYMSYDEIAKNRIICRQFNQLGWHLLNKGFNAAEEYQRSSLKAVKLLLPRRESERRKHPLSKKCDILTAIETRLSMLSMAFSRFIETKLCCFIPGKVIDELFRVMRSLDDIFSGCCEPQPPLQILQELRDVSTMAMEYFEDKIAPDLRKKEMAALTSQRTFTVFNVSNELASTSSNEISNYDFHLKPSSVLKRQSIEKMVKEYCARYQNDDIRCKNKKKKEAVERKKLSRLTKIVRQQGKSIKELTEAINEQSVRLSNSEAVINDLKRQHDEWKHNVSQKFSNLMDISPEESVPFNINSPSGSKQKVTTDEKAEESVSKKRKYSGTVSQQDTAPASSDLFTAQ